MTQFLKNKNPVRFSNRIFNVDPTRFALVSLRVKSRILLNKLQARVHKSSVTKRPSFARKSFCDTQRTRNSRVILLLV